MRCCATCRLLGETRTCAACGTTTVELVSSSTELFEEPRNEVKVRAAKWGCGPFVILGLVVVAILVGGTLWIGESIANRTLHVNDREIGNLVLAFLAAGGAIGLVLGFVRFYRRRRDRVKPRMSAVPFDWRDLTSEDGMTELVGVARKHRALATSHDDGERCLASAAFVRRGGKTIAWEGRTVEFLVEREDERPVLVTGAVWLDVPGVDHGSDTGGGRTVCGRLPLMRIWELDADIETRRLDAGMRVRITGPVTHEARPELASGYRDATSEVVKGRARALAIVSPDPSTGASSR